MTKYSASFQSGDLIIEVVGYDTAKEAQDALMSNPIVGHFRYLGDVRGDISIDGKPCEYAPRNGGAVSIDTLELEDD